MGVLPERTAGAGPDTQAKLRKIGFEPIGKDAAAFQEFFRGDVKKWTEFVKERGLKEPQ